MKQACDPPAGDWRKPRFPVPSSGFPVPIRGLTSNTSSSIHGGRTNVLASGNKSSRRHPRRLLLEKWSVGEQLWSVLGGGTEGPATLGRTERGVRRTIFRFVRTNPQTGADER